MKDLIYNVLLSIKQENLNRMTKIVMSHHYMEQYLAISTLVKHRSTTICPE